MNFFLTRFEFNVGRDMEKYAEEDEDMINKTLDEFQDQNDDPKKRKDVVALLAKLFRRKVRIDQKDGKPIIAEEIKIHPKLLMLLKRDLPELIADIDKQVGTKMGGMKVTEYIDTVYEEYRYKKKLEELDESGHIKIEEFEWRMLQSPEFLNRLDPHDVHLVFRSLWRKDIDELTKQCKQAGLETIKKLDPDLLKRWPPSILHALHPDLKGWVDFQAMRVFWSDNYKHVGVICLFVFISAYAAYFIVSKSYGLKPPKYQPPVATLPSNPLDPEGLQGAEVEEEEEEEEEEEPIDEENPPAPTPFLALLSFLVVQVVLFGILMGILMMMLRNRSLVWIFRGVEIYEMMIIYLAYVLASGLIFLTAGGVEWMKPVLFGMDEAQLSLKDPTGGVPKDQLYHFFQVNMMVILSICTTYLFLPVATNMSARLQSAELKERLKDQ